MVRSRLVLGGFGVLATLGLLVALPRRSSGPSLDLDRASSVCKLVSDAVGDWFWWHGSLPMRYEDVSAYGSNQPSEWRPEPGWRVSFRVIPGTVDDAFYGGHLSRLAVTIAPSGTKPITSVESVDLRDPTKLWKPHHTELGPSLEGGLARKERNVAAAVAEAVWSAGQDMHRLKVTQDEVDHTWPGSSLVKRAVADYGWVVEGKHIRVTHRPSGRAYDFPLAGPSSVNERVLPSVLPKED